jgi:hypothetical protein
MKNDKSFLSYSTIVDAVHGQSDAVQEVLKHYDRYITTLATRTMFDAYGEPHLCVDITLKHRLESKLLGRVGAFKLNKEI